MTLLFILITGLYLLRTAQLAAVFYSLNNIVSTGNTPDFYFFQYFPEFLLFPFLYSLAAVLFFYCALKLRDDSPLGWFLSLISSSIVPTLLWFVGKNAISGTGLIFFGHIWMEPTTLCGFFISALLIFYRHKYNAEGKPIEKKYRIFLVLFFLLIVFPIILFNVYVRYRIITNDYNRAKISDKVKFPVKRPQYLPGNRVYETNFFVAKKSLVASKKTVQANFNYPISEMLNGKAAGLITLQQSKPSENFNMTQFLKEETATGEAKKISLDISKGKADIFAVKDEKKIYFTTNDNLLIKIKAYYISEKELIDFANSLK